MSEHVTLGMGIHPWSPRLPSAFKAAATARGVALRNIDLESLHIDSNSGAVLDTIGAVEVTHLLPALLYLLPNAREGYIRLGLEGALALNSVESIDAADDKAQTWRILKQHDVPQIESRICALDSAEIARAIESFGGTAVLKRAHGAQGRWVRLINDLSQLENATTDFDSDGPTSVVVQPVIAAALGASIRVIVLNGRCIASTLRTNEGDWRSNIALGATQSRIELNDQQSRVAVAATEALGLRFAGVDLTPEPDHVLAIEVNACPDFTSMASAVPIDIADLVVEATLDL